jgi:hypothetical protein
VESTGDESLADDPDSQASIVGVMAKVMKRAGNQIAVLVLLGIILAARFILGAQVMSIFPSPLHRRNRSPVRIPDAIRARLKHVGFEAIW